MTTATAEHKTTTVTASTTEGVIEMSDRKSTKGTKAAKITEAKTEPTSIEAAEAAIEAEVVKVDIISAAEVAFLDSLPVLPGGDALPEVTLPQDGMSFEGLISLAQHQQAGRGISLRRHIADTWALGKTLDAAFNHPDNKGDWRKDVLPRIGLNHNSDYQFRTIATELTLAEAMQLGNVLRCMNAIKGQVKAEERAAKALVGEEKKSNGEGEGEGGKADGFKSPWLKAVGMLVTVDGPKSLHISEALESHKLTILTRGPYKAIRLFEEDTTLDDIEEMVKGLGEDLDTIKANIEGDEVVTAIKAINATDV
jgi:hypothetical protein